MRAVVVSRCGVLTVSSVATLLVIAAVAHAGEWVQASCVNPDGSASTSQGWSGGSSGTINSGSSNDTNCGPGSPAGAQISAASPAAVYAEEYIQYAPPGGSTLDGGVVNVTIAADGEGPTASAVASINEPGPGYDGSDLIFACSPARPPDCSGIAAPYNNIYAGNIDLPSNHGGDLYLEASCGGSAGGECDSGPEDFGTWSEALLNSADLELLNGSSPTGSGFGGSLLTPDTHGTANIDFTAGDPGGPGVYQVIARIDGSTVYQGTPDSNGGECYAPSNYQGDLVFDYSQPCKQSESVDIPVSTAALPDGTHRLQVYVEDAAQNVSAVLDQSISTVNRTTPSSTTGEAPPAATPSTSAPSAPAYVFKFDRKSRQRASKVLHRTFGSSPFALTGTLLSPSGVPVDNVAITVQAGRSNGTDFHAVAHGASDGSGHFTIRIPRGDSRIVKIGAGSGVVAVMEKVAANVRMKIRSLRQRRLVFTGKVGIQLHGQRPQVTISDLAGKTWQPFAQVKVDRHGNYRYIERAPRKLTGYTFTFQAATPGTSDWAAGRSRIQKAAVR